MKSKKGIFSTSVTNNIPISNINLSEDKKVDVLLALMHDIRSNINSWTERAYQSTIWSVGMLLTIVGFWLSYGKINASGYGIYFIIGVFVLGIFNQAYLFAARRAHRGNGAVITKIEVALKLCDLDSYIVGKRFFGYSGKWISSKSLIILQTMHAITILIVAGIILMTLNQNS